jgi:DNA adenine methylase
MRTVLTGGPSRVRVETRRIQSLPLLKWPGGKRRLLDRILPFVPERFKGYFEPFLGGGALFFALQPDRARLSDNNAELVRAYLQIRDSPWEVIRELRKLRNSEKDYYRVRSSVPQEDSAGAARLIYLTTLAFNGIYRVNLRGRFNVPYGYKTHLDPCDERRILESSAILKKAFITHRDFEGVVKEAQRGDLIYFDPPYTVAHANNGFIKYNAKMFSWEDQVRLAAVARALVERGCTVLVSNADHFSIRRLYDGFELNTIQRNSVIAASSMARSVVTECLFYGPGT